MSALAVRRLSVDRGGKAIVVDISFTVAAGEIVAVMGPSGTGKSTILRAIAGLEPITSGTVDLSGLVLSAGAVPTGARLRELHRRIGFVFQSHHLFAHKTACENVWLAPVHVSGQLRGEAEARARALLDGLGVGHRADAYPHALSGGEAQRVAIARALAMERPLLLMDEPTASLDADRRTELARTLRGLATDGRSLVVASHDSAFVGELTERTITLHDGRLVGDRRPAEVF
jgi:ABC-type polar amino acid transport system ATPase subunit